MLFKPGIRCPAVTLLWLTIVVCGGCSTLQLPAIDPSGERIFLPGPSYTTFTSCGDQLPAFSCFPEPAWSEPPPVPACPEFVQPPVLSVPACPPIAVPCPPRIQPCPPAVPACPPAVAPTPTVAPRGTGVIPRQVAPASQQDRLILTPTKIVAPVGSEVLLLAGICGPEGYYVTHQPIEWLLSQDSVGNFVDVSHGRHEHFTSLLPNHRSGKFSSNYAVTRSSTRSQRIDRGTTRTDDDVLLQKGQAWITLTSPTEGVSYVTSVATGAENWEQRRQSAAIHWVDAQWTLPANAIVRAGERLSLTTKVTRTSTGAGASRWLVRYEIVGGPEAVFASNGQTTVDVPTNEAGEAIAVVAPRSVQPGTTQVRIQILTPENANGGGDRVPVGEGSTTVTWSAPGLAIAAAGPAAVAVGAPVTYQLVVSNPGDLPSENVFVVAELPVLMQYVSANPPPSQAAGRQLRFQLGSLGPLDSVTLEIQAQAASPGDQRFFVRAESSDGLVAENEVATRVIESALQIRFVDPPSAAVVGQRVHFNMEIANVGDQTVSNVVLRDRFDAGLQHTGGERSPIEKSLGNIEAGGVRRIGVSFFARETGRLCHTITATGDGGHAASTQTCVQVREPTYDVTVQVAGPGQVQVGESALYEITATNIGEATLSNVRIVAVVESTLDTTSITRGGVRTAEGFAWELASLAPGASEVRRVQTTAIDVDPQAEVLARVSSAQGARATNSSVTGIIAPPQPAAPPANASPPSGARAERSSPPGEVSGDSRASGASNAGRGEAGDSDPTPAAPRSDQLQLSVTATEPSIKVGETTTYIVELTNDRDVPDRDVLLTFRLPPGLKFERFVSISARLSLTMSGDGREVEVERIAEIRPGARRLFRVEASGVRPGRWTFEANATSQQSTTPARGVEETQVYP